MQERVDRERERVREQKQAGGWSVERRPTCQRGAVGRLLYPERDRRERRRVETGREDGERGILLDLVRPAGDRDRGPTDEHSGLEDVAQRRSYVLERADVVRGREADREVAPFAVEALEDLARRLADRLRRDRVLRQRRRERAHGARMAVRGTTTVEPDSVIVQRASIVPGAGNSSSGRTSR